MNDDYITIHDAGIAIAAVAALVALLTALLVRR